MCLVCLSTGQLAMERVAGEELTVFDAVVDMVNVEVNGRERRRSSRLTGFTLLPHAVSAVQVAVQYRDGVLLRSEASTMELRQMSYSSGCSGCLPPGIRNRVERVLSCAPLAGGMFKNGLGMDSSVSYCGVL